MRRAGHHAGACVACQTAATETIERLSIMSVSLVKAGVATHAVTIRPARINYVHPDRPARARINYVHPDRPAPLPYAGCAECATNLTAYGVCPACDAHLLGPVDIDAPTGQLTTV